jgi:hypothetical protein
MKHVSESPKFSSEVLIDARLEHDRVSSGEHRPHEAAEIHRTANVARKFISDTRLEPNGRDGFILRFSDQPLDELTEAANRHGRAAARYQAK